MLSELYCNIEFIFLELVIFKNSSPSAEIIINSKMDCIHKYIPNIAILKNENRVVKKIVMLLLIRELNNIINQPNQQYMV